MKKQLERQRVTIRLTVSDAAAVRAAAEADSRSVNQWCRLALAAAAKIEKKDK